MLGPQGDIFSGAHISCGQEGQGSREFSRRAGSETTENIPGGGVEIQSKRTDSLHREGGSEIWNRCGPVSAESRQSLFRMGVFMLSFCPCSSLILVFREESSSS